MGVIIELMTLMTLLLSKTSFNKCIHVHYDIRQNNEYQNKVMNDV